LPGVVVDAADICAPRRVVDAGSGSLAGIAVWPLIRLGHEDICVNTNLKTERGGPAVGCKR